MRKSKLGITLFLLPAMLLFGLIFFKSIVSLFGTSFTEWHIGSQPVFNFGYNYIHLWQDKDFVTAMLNTIVWILLQSTVHVFLGVSVALILSRKKWYWKFVRTSFMIPNIVSAAAMGMMFIFILSPQYGIVNQFFQFIGFENFDVNWFFSKETAFFAVTMTWLPFAGTVTILTLAEIAAIDTAIFEAAHVDGATDWDIMWRITIPNLRSIIGTCTLLAGTSMLQKLDILLMTTQGGPLNRTLNLPLYVYNALMKTHDYGIANTASIYLILLGLILTLAVRKIYRIGQD